MKIEEAIEQLQGAKLLIIAQGKDWLDERDFPVLECAINALEKQIPKKFKMADDNYTPVCPVCGEAIWYMKWCNNCGQRLDKEKE